MSTVHSAGARTILQDWNARVPQLAAVTRSTFPGGNAIFPPRRLAEERTVRITGERGMLEGTMTTMAG
jgi:hypothetical protein